jgi:hypothetical protein
LNKASIAMGESTRCSQRSEINGVAPQKRARGPSTAY